MSNDGGVVEENVKENDKKVASLSEDSSFKLSKTSLQIEEAYGCPLDIEWAFVGKELYLLQARPITTFDKETTSEILHAADDPTRIEDEYNTTANAGEVMSKAASHLGLTIILDMLKPTFQYLYAKRNPYCSPFFPFESMVIRACNFCLLSMPNFILRFYSKDEVSFLAEASLIAGFGRIPDEPHMYDQLHRRNKTFPTTFLPYQMIFFIKDLLFVERGLNKAWERINKEKLDVSHCSNAFQMYRYIWNKIIDRIEFSGCHFACSLNSTIYNNLVMSIFRSANKEWSTTVFNDVALMLSSCGDLESADIPQSVQKLVHTIRTQGDAEKFKKMTAQEALQWMENEDTPAGKMFKTFIERHGHRCLMEYDVYSQPWRVNKLPLMKILQEAIDVPYEEKRFVPASEIIKSFKSPLSGIQKLLLRVLIPLCRNSVMNREKSKSLWVKKMDCLRQCFWEMSEQMVKEGFIPDKELMFFLTCDELVQLLETRNPSLVQKAVRRKAFFPELDKLRFPEITRGVPKPINFNEKKFDNLPSDLEIKGTPVSQGVVQGIARVAVTLQDAALIKPGEILIAYGTDIAWSPYFPLLSGVATELGGLISHGAVVAREYGLPCVVGLFDATLKFKSGDLVLLDGNKGILKRIPKTTASNGTT